MTPLNLQPLISGANIPRGASCPIIFGGVSRGGDETAAGRHDFVLELGAGTIEQLVGPTWALRLFATQLRQLATRIATALSGTESPQEIFSAPNSRRAESIELTEVSNLGFIHHILRPRDRAIQPEGLDRRDMSHTSHAAEGTRLIDSFIFDSFADLVRATAVPRCPKCGRPAEKRTLGDLADVNASGESSAVFVLAVPEEENSSLTLAEYGEALGVERVIVNDEIVRIDRMENSKVDAAGAPGGAAKRRWLVLESFSAPLSQEALFALTDRIIRAERQGFQMIKLFETRGRRTVVGRRVSSGFSCAACEILCSPDPSRLDPDQLRRLIGSDECGLLIDSQLVTDLLRRTVASTLEFFHNDAFDGNSAIGLFRQALIILEMFGFGRYTLASSAENFSPGESLRLQLAALAHSQISGCLIVIEDMLSFLAEDERREILAAMDRTIAPLHTVLLIDPALVHHDNNRHDTAVHGSAAVSSGISLIAEYLGPWVTADTTVRLVAPGEAFSIVRGRSGSGKSLLLRGTAVNLGANRAADECIYLDLLAPRFKEAIPAQTLNLYDPLVDLLVNSGAGRKRGVSREDFSLRRSSFLCTACRGVGNIANTSTGRSWNELCPHCLGDRFAGEILTLRARGFSIAELLEMSVTQVQREFFDLEPIVRRTEELVNLGLADLVIGRAITDLSLGEQKLLALAVALQQRVRRGRRGRPHRAERTTSRRVLLLDHVSVGLDSAEIGALLEIIARLIGQGDTVIAADNHPLLARSADFVLDLGNNVKPVKVT